MTKAEKLDAIQQLLDKLEGARASLYGAEIQDYVYLVEGVETILAEQEYE